MTGQASPTPQDAAPEPTDGVRAPPGRNERDLATLVRGLPLRTLLVLLSGLSVLPLLYHVVPPFGYLLTGGIFGTLVLVPFIKAQRAWPVRALILVAGAGLIHWGAFRLTTLLDCLDERIHAVGVLAGAVICGVPGLAAALLCAVLTAHAAPLRSARKVLALTSVAGFLGAQVFAFPVPIGPIGGYIIWQLLVFLALHYGGRVQPGVSEAHTVPATAAGPMPGAPAPNSQSPGRLD